MQAKSKERLGIGVVGCGNISTTYLRNAALFGGVELRACAACGAVVVDQERHFDWHAAIREGAGRALDYRPDYELIGLVDAITEDDLVSGDEPPLTELYRSDQD